MEPGKPTEGKVLEFPDGDHDSRYWCIGLAAACEMALRRADGRVIYCYEWVPPARP